jgi:hemerythrin superfamily protein
MNAIELLTKQHRTVEELFTKFQRSSRGKDSVAEQILREMTIHSAIEEQVLYPLTRKMVPALGDLVLRSLEEHTVVKWEIASLAMMDAKNERFVPKMNVLKELFMTHVEEEEHELFPKLQKELGSSKLDQMGQQLEQAQESLTSGRRPARPRAAQPPRAASPAARRTRATGRSKPATAKRASRGSRSRASR